MRSGVGVIASSYKVPAAGGNIGYRTFNGSTDAAQLNIGNLASSGSVPGTWIFAGRILSTTADGVIISSPGYDPLDFYVRDTSDNYSFYDGAGNALLGPAITPVDAICVVRAAAGTPVRWSIATHNGTSWSTFTHANDSTTFSNRTYSGSGLLGVMTAPPVSGRVALIAHCSTSISDVDVATLTASLAAWSALTTLTNLWRFDQTPIVDLKGTAAQNSLTGTTVTAAGFPLA